LRSNHGPISRKFARFATLTLPRWRKTARQEPKTPAFQIEKGETLSLVGESGCGKSTVGRAILRLIDITAGEVVLDGRRIDNMRPDNLRKLRRRVQVVFQDPFASLNPRPRSSVVEEAG
jgi:ABC-type oligopeptide transport system ATPase subunit